MENSLLPLSMSVFAGFFAVMNPIANLPIFLDLVGTAEPKVQKKIAKTACINAFLIILFFTIFGKFIFNLFGITIPAFKIAGGLLLFYVGFEMLQSKKSAVSNQENFELDEGLAISPLAIPILAGPGTLVTAMDFVDDASVIAKLLGSSGTYVTTMNFITSGSLERLVIVILVLSLMMSLTYVTFIFGQKISKKIGHNLIVVFAKIMGLLLSIMGAGMIITGLKMLNKLS